MNPICVHSLALAGAVALALAPPAEAGIGDKPPLVNGDVKVKHVYSIAGVVHTNELGTAVTCTSLETTKSILFAVEFMNDLGSPLNHVTAGEGVVELGAGQTRTVASRSTTIFQETDAETGGPFPRFNESARVVSTSTKRVCNAFVVDASADPQVGARLPVYKKTRQRGE
jgi:hypothetical protein